MVYVLLLKTCVGVLLIVVVVGHAVVAVVVGHAAVVVIHAVVVGGVADDVENMRFFEGNVRNEVWCLQRCLSAFQDVVVAVLLLLLMMMLNEVVVVVVVVTWLEWQLHVDSSRWRRRVGEVLEVECAVVTDAGLASHCEQKCNKCVNKTTKTTTNNHKHYSDLPKKLGALSKVTQYLQRQVTQQSIGIQPNRA